MSAELEAAQERKGPGGSAVERRASGPRRRFLLAAEVATPRGAIKVTLRDLSSAGARVEGPIDDLLGRSFVLTSHSLTARARVAWFSDKACGLTFDCPEDADEPLAPLTCAPGPQRRSMTLPAFRRPAVTNATLTAAEEQLVRLWGCERPS